MRKIAVIGAGQAGLLAAHALVKAGHEVTLYSDRTPEQWLTEARPTGTAARFEMSLSFERELGLAHWEKDAPKGEGVHLTASLAPGNRLLTLAGRFDRSFVAVDLRLQSHRWMLDLEARGGKIEIASVTIGRLEQIAAENELTLVGTGKAELFSLFERDEQRSEFGEPQRNLAMLCLKGCELGFDGIPMLPVKFTLLPGVGESFWVPYYHKDVGPSWNCVFEALPGGPMDRFQGATTGEQVLATAKAIVKELVPWDHAWFKDAELSDPNGWLVGKVTPTVRKPVGRLPSGRVVAPIGDAAMALDPVAGQGANNGNKMVRNLVECVAMNGDQPFDAAWMERTFERFYTRHGGPTARFNNLFLRPLPPPMFEFLLAQYGSDARLDNHSGQQALANMLANNFADPGKMATVCTDGGRMRALIQEHTGRPWPLSVASGAVAVGVAQVRQRLGLPPNHPFAGRRRHDGAFAAAASAG